MLSSTRKILWLPFLLCLVKSDNSRKWVLYKPNEVFKFRIFALFFSYQYSPINSIVPLYVTRQDATQLQNGDVLITGGATYPDEDDDLCKSQ